MVGTVLAGILAVASLSDGLILDRRSGDTGFAAVHPIDRAAWIGLSTADAAPAFTRFRKTFVAVAERPLVIDVSADERYGLLLDGKLVGRGPDRGDVRHWTYRTYRFELARGVHVLEAVVSALGSHAPGAQLSWRGGSFVLKASAPYESELTTGVADWEVGAVPNTTIASGYSASGASVCSAGLSFLDARPTTWSRAAVVRKAVAGDTTMGGEIPGWRLFPTELPEQTAERTSPGRFVAARDGRGKKDDGVYAEADLRDARLAALDGVLKGRPMTIPANAALRAVWDLGDYYTPYPFVRVRGGSNAVVRLRFSEAPKDAQREKGNRNEIVGKSFGGAFRGDELVSNGGESTLTTPWWRAGRYAELLIETKDEPLELVALELEDSHYPVGAEGSFSTPDDPSLDAVWRICRRGMEMCAHEMVMDCPYYEQMMYGGDARIQGLILSALGSEDALVRRVIDFYAFNQRDDGLVPMVYPARHDKASATYSLAWALMFGDYAMWHDDTAWLRARLPSLHHLLSGLAAYENADGLLEDLPGWNFIDWVAEPEPWYRGDAPDGRLGKAENALNNLFYVLALQSGAKANRVVGDEAMAAVWDGRAKRVAEKLVAKYWDERRGALADTLDHAHFSEHAQCLALLGGLLPKDKAARAFETLVSAKDLSRTTVYFSHYLFETYLLYGRADIILKRLDLWRDFVKVGLKTPLESPSPTLNARSDCHAWGSHPIYHLVTGIAGIRPGSEGFKTVRIAPAPGPLTRFTATCPHPKGRIAVDLVFEQGACRGTVTTPVAGAFVWGGRTVGLKAGENAVKLNTPL